MRFSKLPYDEVFRGFPFMFADGSTFLKSKRSGTPSQVRAPEKLSESTYVGPKLDLEAGKAARFRFEMPGRLLE